MKKYTLLITIIFMLTNCWVWQLDSIAQEEEPSAPQKVNILEMLLRTYKSLIQTMTAHSTLEQKMDLTQQSELPEPTELEADNSKQQVIIDGQVISVSGDKIYINLGTADGIQKGMLLKVYRHLTLTNAATSEEINKKQTVGKVLLIDVEENLSEAIAPRFELKKDMQIKVGDMVKAILDKVKPQQEQVIQPTTDVKRKGEAYIVSVNGEKLYLDMVNGIKVGTEVKIIKEAAQIKHPVTGELRKMGTDKEARGKLVEIKEKMSVVQILSPEEIANFRRGDLVKIVKNNSDD